MNTARFMNTKVIVIAAVSRDGVYGIGNSIPWRISSEMKHFKEKTTGHTVVMGRGTWESLPLKFRPLPGRTNVVVTNTPDYRAEGAIIASSIEQAIRESKTEKVFCIGGHDVWYHVMSLADEALITVVDKDFCSDAPCVCMARELLIPSEKWPHIKLQSVQKSEEGEEIPYVINHWVR